ncbi:hypothetical protein FHT72_006309 [Rhizobium sp. BK077]|uniref:hypothetical protein n=1 Tax=unclassified Rhizobium TaxID=2613769 RepID=UPI00161FA59C|nr:MULTISPECIES: hypothetical protein [unclassified Rhizobium]MBB3302804.1 hypothetical protein [Rhizobium sp. BK112]MBB3371777.1 hypothetical protein [Rhizobium sp. BK077]MBB4182548.1 hypothetical protein [Rhizobium sp. BK109]
MLNILRYEQGVAGSNSFKASIIHLASRTVYLAWKPSGQKIKVNPDVKAWPEKAKAELRQWAAKWK